MTASLKAMHAESVVAFAKMQALPYDPLDISQSAFSTDYAAYQAIAQSIERRLAVAVKQVLWPVPQSFESHYCSYPFHTSHLLASLLVGKASRPVQQITPLSWVIGVQNTASCWSSTATLCVKECALSADF